MSRTDAIRAMWADMNLAMETLLDELDGNGLPDGEYSGEEPSEGGGDGAGGGSEGSEGGEGGETEGGSGEGSEGGGDTGSGGGTPTPPPTGGGGTPTPPPPTTPPSGPLPPDSVLALATTPRAVGAPVRSGVVRVVGTTEGVNYAFDPDVKVTYPFQVPSGTIADVCRDCVINGPFGVGPNTVGGGTAFHNRPGNPPGGVRLLEDCRFEGWHADSILMRGIKGELQTARNIYLGRRYAKAIDNAHADCFVFPEIEGDILLENILIDRRDAPVTGSNNIIRMVPNTGSDPATTSTVFVRGMVVFDDVRDSGMIAVGHRANYKPKLDVQDSWFPVSVRGYDKLFFKGAPIHRWVNVRDTHTGELIPAPPGALTV